MLLHFLAGGVLEVLAADVKETELGLALFGYFAEDLLFSFQQFPHIVIALAGGTGLIFADWPSNVVRQNILGAVVELPQQFFEFPLLFAQHTAFHDLVSGLLANLLLHPFEEEAFHLSPSRKRGPLALYRGQENPSVRFAHL